MSLSRRRFLKGAGASVLVLGAGGASWILTREPKSAVQPWELAGGNSNDFRMRALSYAILAPNPHNRQPWLVRLRGDDALDLFCQLDRRLPETDPFDRQITIGLGAFTGLLQIAAAHFGFEARVEAFPEGQPQPRLDKRPIARVRFVKSGAPSREIEALWAQIPQRRSNKEPFDLTRPVALETVEKMLVAANLPTPKNAPHVGFTIENDRISDLRRFTYEAFEIEAEDDKAARESLKLMRIGKAEIEANPDGIDIGGAIPDTLNALGMLTREAIADRSSTAYAQFLQMQRDVMSSAMGYVWLSTPDNSRASQLRAGQDWVRLNLAASHVGLAMHPLSQSLQEFPAMAPFFTQIHEKLGIETPARLQMFARIGYGPIAPPSPRWPLQTRLLRV